MKSQRQMALATKLGLGFGALILILAVITVVVYWASSTVKTEAVLTQEDSVAATLAVLDMELATVEVQQALQDISATRGLDGYDDGFNVAQASTQASPTSAQSLMPRTIRMGFAAWTPSLSPSIITTSSAARWPRPTSMAGPRRAIHTWPISIALAANCQRCSTPLLKNTSSNWMDQWHPSPPQPMG